LSIIKADDLTKVYRVPVRQPGFAGTISAFLRPEFREVVAVDRVSFCVEPGEIVGYIGPNGAGKSSTIKMLCGILVPTSGEVRVGGIVPHLRRQQNAMQIGVVFGQRTQLWWDLPVRETFYLLKNLYRIPDALYRENIDLFGELLGLRELWDVPVRLLSLGQRMRADIAASVIHRPRLLFLDEPTIGLDVVAKERIRQFLRQIREEYNTTVVLTTHDLRDIEETCQRVLMIHRGQLVFDGALHALRDKFGNRSLMRVEIASRDAWCPDRLPGNVQLVQRNGRYAYFEFSRQQISASDAIRSVCSVMPVRDVTLQDADLESVVKRVYGGEDV